MDLTDKIQHINEACYIADNIHTALEMLTRYKEAAIPMLNIDGGLESLLEIKEQFITVEKAYEGLGDAFKNVMNNMFGISVDDLRRFAKDLTGKLEEASKSNSKPDTNISGLVIPVEHMKIYSGSIDLLRHKWPNIAEQANKLISMDADQLKSRFNEIAQSWETNWLDNIKKAQSLLAVQDYKECASKWPMVNMKTFANEINSHIASELTEIKKMLDAANKPLDIIKNQMHDENKYDSYRAALGTRLGIIAMRSASLYCMIVRDYARTLKVFTRAIESGMNKE